MIGSRWKSAFWVCLILLVLSNIFWYYQLTDARVSYSYLSVTSQDRGKIIESLGKLIVKGANKYSEQDVLYLLRQANPKALIVQEANKITYEQIEFNFKDDKLVEVTTAY